MGDYRSERSGPGRPAGRSVLEGAFLLLEELTRVGEAGLTRLAAGAGLPKATAYGLLDQLVSLGAVQRDNGRYRIGQRMFHLGQAWRPAPVLRTAARNPLRQLSTAVLGASVNLTVMSDPGQILIVCAIRGEGDDVSPVRTGMLFPHGCAQWRLMAAHAPDIAPPPQYSPSAWKRLITDVHERDLAFDYESPCAPEVAIVGAPVRIPTGQVVAAVAVGVLDNRRLPSIAPAVQRAAGMISANLARLPEAAQNLAPS